MQWAVAVSLLGVAWEEHNQKILTLAAVLAALGVIYRYTIRPAIAFFKRIDRVVSSVESQLYPNGGSTLRDAVNRIEERLLKLETLAEGNERRDHE